MEKIECFICGNDITNKTKCLSFFNYPDKLWDETIKDWDKDFRKLFNKAMCQECAKLDLEIAHNNSIKKSLLDEIEKLKKELAQKQLKVIKFLGITISF